MSEHGARKAKKSKKQREMEMALSSKSKSKSKKSKKEREMEMALSSDSECEEKPRKSKSKKSKKEREMEMALPSDSEDEDGKPRKSKKKKDKKEKSKREREMEMALSSSSSADEEEDERPRKSKKKRVKRAESSSEDEDEKESTPKKTAAASPSAEVKMAKLVKKHKKVDRKALKKMSSKELRGELERRGLPTDGDKSDLTQRIKDDMKALQALTPQTMSAAELREELDKLDLDTEGDKRELIHRLRVEIARLSGSGPVKVDVSLWTVKQLKEWLNKEGIPIPRATQKKQFYVDLVNEHMDDDDDSDDDVDPYELSLKELQHYCKQHKIKALKKSDKQYYIDLIEDFQTEKGDAGGLLFDDDEILHMKALFFGQKFVVVQGDLSAVASDAVVCPTNGHLQLGGGVGRALVKAAGGVKSKLVAGVEKWLKKNDDLEVTECTVTKGHELEAKWVILTYSPRWDANDKDASRDELMRSVQSILEQADEKKVKSICLPSIGSGVNGYPKDVAAATTLKALQDYFQEAGPTGSDIQEIYFVLFDQESVDTYVKELQGL